MLTDAEMFRQMHNMSVEAQPQTWLNRKERRAKEAQNRKRKKKLRQADMDRKGK